MMMQMVVAVALGLTQANQPTAQPIDFDPAIAAQVGQFTQTVDTRGTLHVRGTDVRGQSYDLVMDRNGFVEAEIGERVVRFHVAERS